jgi:hypothetical protein
LILNLLFMRLGMIASKIESSKLPCRYVHVD